MPLKLPDLTQTLQETTRKGAGSIRWQQPRFVAFLPPCNHECPAGEDIQAWLRLCAGRRLRDGVAKAGRGKSPSRDPRARLLSHLRKRLQPDIPRRAGRHSRHRALPRRSRRREGLAHCRGAAQRQERAGRGRRAGRPFLRLSSRARRMPGRDPRRGGRAGRHDGLWHTGLSPASRHLAQGDRGHSLPSGNHVKMRPEGR